MSLLDRLTLDILSCTKCGDEKITYYKDGRERSRKPLVKIPDRHMPLTESSTRPVPGHNLGKNGEMPRYLFIGEAPGQTEDEVGEGFIGRSGQYLRNTLIPMARIKLEQCRFTNVIHCHPFENRNPLAAELKACFPFLEREIQIIQPEIIFTLGKFSTEALIGKISLKGFHGQVFEWNGIPVIPMYHPAAVNRAVNKRELENAFRSVPKRLKEWHANKNRETQYEVIENREQLDKLKSDLILYHAHTDFPAVGFDIETIEAEESRKSGVDPRTNVLAGISLSFSGRAVYIPTAEYKFGWIRPGDYGVSDWEEVRRLALETIRYPLATNCPLIIHNAKFEIESLMKYNFKIEFPICTMICAYLLGQPTLGLKDVVKREFGITMTELTDYINIKKQPVTDIPLSHMVNYASADAEMALRLWTEKFEPVLRERNQLDLLHHRFLALLPWITKAEMTGMQIDLAKLEEIRPLFEDKLHELEEGIHAQYEGLTEERINLNSGPQKRELLYETLGIMPPAKLTKGGQFSTDKDELEKIKQRHPIIPLLIERGSINQNITTYLDGIPKQVKPYSGRVHPSVNQTTADTSRFSYSPNWQNIPARTELGRKIRQCVAAPPGFVIVAIDQSQIELRLAGHFSQDPEMLKAFQTGQSIHKKTCMEVYGITEDSEEWHYRYKISKNGNFAEIYEVGIDTLMDTLECDRETAIEFDRGHKSLYRVYYQWTGFQKKKARRMGYAETLLGFRRYLPDLRSPIKHLRERAERQAVNTPIQGTSADVIQMAMVEIHSAMEEQKFESQMLFQVHDELIWLAPEDEVKALVELAVPIMENPYMDLTVPTPVEVQVGQNWGELEEYVMEDAA